MSQAYQRILVLKLVQSGLLKLGLASCCFFVRSDAHIGCSQKCMRRAFHSQSKGQ